MVLEVDLSNKGLTEIPDNLPESLTTLLLYNNQISEIKNLQSQLIDQRVKNILQMKEMLTPKQFEKLHSFDRMGKRGKGRRGSGRGRGKWNADRPIAPE